MGRSLDQLLSQRLEALRQVSLYRDPSEPLRRRAARGAANCRQPLLDVSSNDYLGLARFPVSRETSGARASRLLGGTHPRHTGLEGSLASWLGAEASLLFSSGYAANMGVLSSLASREDVVVSDALNHASIIDGCRLSSAHVQVVPHRDVEGVRKALEGHRGGMRWIVTESYFSMEATVPDFRALDELCREYDACMIVDEAHALGVVGRGGRGLAHEAGVQPDVLIGTFGKGFGAHGAFVVGSQRLRTYLWNRARSFVFSTATSPALAATLSERLEQVAAADERRAHLNELCRKLEAQLVATRHETPMGRTGPIFPVILGPAVAALKAADQLADAGILAPAIRPPTVPENRARVRITLTAAHTEHDVDRLASALRTVRPA